jgi:hypothetical protein
VPFPVEVVAGENFGRRVEGLVVDENGAEDRPLGVGVVGERLFLGYELGGQRVLPEGGLVYCG